MEGAPHGLLPEAALTPAASSGAPGCTLPSDRPPLVRMLLRLSAAKASSSDRQSRQGRLRCPAPGSGPGTALNTLPSLGTHRQPVPSGSYSVRQGGAGLCPQLSASFSGSVPCTDQSAAGAPPGGTVRTARTPSALLLAHQDRCPNRVLPSPTLSGPPSSSPVAPHELTAQKGSSCPPA